MPPLASHGPLTSPGQTRNSLKLETRWCFLHLSPHSLIKSSSTVDTLSLGIHVRDVTSWSVLSERGTHTETLSSGFPVTRFQSCLSQSISSCSGTHAVLTSSIVDNKRHFSQQYLPGMLCPPSHIRTIPGREVCSPSHPHKSGLSILHSHTCKLDLNFFFLSQLLLWNNPPPLSWPWPWIEGQKQTRQRESVLEHEPSSHGAHFCLLDLSKPFLL